MIRQGQSIDWLKISLTHYQRYYCTKESNKKWSKTVLVPKSDLPGRRSPSFEQTLLQKPCFAGLYKDQEKRVTGKKFVLHDGPPYANGSVHFGHIINKTLKDIICRYKIRQGYQVNFTPGWDCHGLPIELKVYKDSPGSSEWEPLEVRRKAREQAELAIKDQMSSFVRMGVAADWNNPYTTASNKFVVNQLEAFKVLHQRNLIHRSFLPIYFSPSSKTTLAESELEYNSEHVSPSIFYQFKVDHDISRWGNKRKNNVYALIWTTTPWTLPGNQAIVYSPDITYVLAYSPELLKHFIIAQDVLPAIQDKLATPLITKFTLDKGEFSRLKYIHPMKPESSLPFVEANYVTIEKGTGLVHCAPNHGREDFTLARQNNLTTNQCLVDDEGNFVSGTHSMLDGKSVLDEGSKLVMDLLKEDIVHREDYIHSYPYDWRTGKPVLIKTSQQWFLDIERIRDQCLQELDRINFYPAGIHNKIRDELKQRPPWCISRQRIWGVPIPVFYQADDPSQEKAIVSPTSVDYLIDIVKKNGIDSWWSLPVEQLICPSYANELKVKPENLVKGRDIFDVWFDSGMTWNSALSDDKISDLYLEGMDQCHGWFQTSLILSVALRSKAPYKSVYVHGFAVDSTGRKMSKSLGNVVDPIPLLENRYGADVLRLFVARDGSHHGNVKVDDDRLSATSDLLLKVRNTMKFCLGCLNDYVPTGTLSYDQLDIMDRYMLHLLSNLYATCTVKYDEQDFKAVLHESQSFIENFSSLYLKIVKDSLYCDAKESIQRRSCQMVINNVIEVFNNFLSPVIPFLFEEINQVKHRNENCSSCFLNDWFECPSNWNNAEAFQCMETIRKIKDIIDHHTDDVKHFGKPFEAHIVCLNQKDYETLKLANSQTQETMDSDLLKILQLAAVDVSSSLQPDSGQFDITIQPKEDFPFQIFLKKTSSSMCPRCRRYHAANEAELCHRCDIVTKGLTAKSV